MNFCQKPDQTEKKTGRFSGIALLVVAESPYFPEGVVIDNMGNHAEPLSQRFGLVADFFWSGRLVLTYSSPHGKLGVHIPHSSVDHRAGICSLGCTHSDQGNFAGVDGGGQQKHVRHRVMLRVPTEIPFNRARLNRFPTNMGKRPRDESCMTVRLYAERSPTQKASGLEAFQPSSLNSWSSMGRSSTRRITTPCLILRRTKRAPNDAWAS